MFHRVIRMRMGWWGLKGGGRVLEPVVRILIGKNKSRGKDKIVKIGKEKNSDKMIGKEKDKSKCKN